MTNYFELYDLPLSFHPDATAVKNKYYELSRKYHPDRFSQSGTAEMSEALGMAAMNNDAYKTLRNTDATMAYILKLHQLLEDEEKYNLPPAFLMEMMDLNEAVSDYEGDPDNGTVKQQATNTLAGQLEEWQQATDQLTQRFDTGDHGNELLLKIKDQYFRKKYLLRIQERIDRFATH